MARTITVKKVYPIKGRRDFFKYVVMDAGKIAKGMGKEMYFDLKADADRVAKARISVNKTLLRAKKAEAKAKKKTQGYNARMDESLGMRRGASRTKKQSLKSRRDEAKGMNKASGKRAYSSVRSMDKIKYYDDSQMKRLLKTNSRDWESIALKKGYDVDMRNYKWFKKK